MLAEFLYQFTDTFFGFNVFRYITVKSALAAVTALLFSMIVGPKIITLLKKNQIGEEIRTEGPATHQQKKGTPTMGGLIIIISILIGVLLWADPYNIYVSMILLATLFEGRKKNEKGIGQPL
jgi:phospho-N-acetylmuramoyl-pentapeptide-transferase